MKNIIYDMNEYVFMDDMIGYDGFITPDATFYRVRKTNYFSKELTHPAYAKVFVREQEIYDEFKASGFETEIDFLEHGLNYIRYACLDTSIAFLKGAKSKDIIKEYYENTEHNYTEEQLKLFENICDLNDEILLNINKYDLNEYNKIEKMAGYNGYITPDGIFYRVRPMIKEADSLVSHQEWAEEFVKYNKMKNNYNHNEMNAHVYLTKVLGYYDYSANFIKFENDSPTHIDDFTKFTEKQSYVFDELNQINFGFRLLKERSENDVKRIK